jgi:4-carboxymuconolactone decarboxylase
MARIPLLETTSDVPADQEEEVLAIEEVLGHVSGPFGALMYSPGLARRVMEAGKHVRLHSSLEPKHRQLVIATLAREMDCPVEWFTHYRNAVKAGISEESLATLRVAGPVEELAADERQIVTYVRQLLREHKVDPELTTALLEAHGTRWLVELTATAGQYLYVATVLNAFDITPQGVDDERMRLPVRSA